MTPILTATLPIELTNGNTGRGERVAVERSVPQGQKSLF